MTLLMFLLAICVCARLYLRGWLVGCACAWCSSMSRQHNALFKTSDGNNLVSFGCFAIAFIGFCFVWFLYVLILLLAITMTDPLELIQNKIETIQSLKRVHTTLHTTFSFTISPVIVGSAKFTTVVLPPYHNHSY